MRHSDKFVCGLSLVYNAEGDLFQEETAYVWRWKYRNSMAIAVYLAAEGAVPNKIAHAEVCARAVQNR